MNMKLTHTVASRLLAAAQEAVGQGVTFIDRKENESFFSWETVVSRAQHAAGYLWLASLQILPHGAEQAHSGQATR